MSTLTHRAVTLHEILGDPTRLSRFEVVERLHVASSELAQHASVVAGYVDLMASVAELSESERDAIVDAAWLHDIGKLTLSHEALHRPGPLTDAEWIEMRGHPSRAATYLERSGRLAPAALYVRQHHEWHNGAGYPIGLQNAQISLGSRLIGVADAYDAMTSWRPYRPMLTESKAIAELRKCAGTQFDPQTVDLFIMATNGLRKGVSR